MFTETELQIDRKTKKLKNQNLFLRTNIFKSHKRLKITIYSDRLSLITSVSQLGLLIIRLSHEPIKIKYIKKQKIQKILRHDTVQGTIIIRYYLQELYNVIFNSS